MADLMNKTVASIMTALIAVVLLASAFIPTAVRQIDALSNMFKGDEAVAGYVVLLGVVITMTIIGVVLGVVKGYISDGAEVYETITEER